MDLEYGAILILDVTAVVALLAKTRLRFTGLRIGRVDLSFLELQIGKIILKVGLNCKFVLFLCVRELKIETRVLLDNGKSAHLAGLASLIKKIEILLTAC